ncbi:MAG: Maf family protein, partial [Herbinix sp.]|nr:Maf family protein [Herbinix sp.]
MYQIILASASPRRKEIMDLMGIPYNVITGDVEEITDETNPAEMVQAIARLKATSIASSLETKDKEYGEVIVIAADTMVFYREHTLGKPKDEADAVRMLQMLSDDEHEVYTGVSIVIKNKDGKEENISLAVGTKVYVQRLTTEQIMDYIATGEPMDKAGAYAIQGKFGIYIKEIVGDYYNVVGFPIARIYETLL